MQLAAQSEEAERRQRNRQTLKLQGFSTGWEASRICNAAEVRTAQNRAFWRAMGV